MWIANALLALVLSLLSMLMIAWKWNIPIRSILMSAIIITLIVSIPFLLIYYHYEIGWLLLIIVAGQIGLSIFIALALVLFHFSRDPERLPPKIDRVIISPADGEVIYIKFVPTGFSSLVTKNGCDYHLQELAGIEFTNCAMIIIGIEMNILNVHVNRCPIEGHVSLIKHINGKYLSLRKKEAPFLNARCTTLIENAEISVGIVQIASRLVRRVDNYLHIGETVGLGQRLGMIRFGSQVAAIIPNREDINITVRIGQKVFAGTTILASYIQR